jgi:hypothetical protein
MKLSRGQIDLHELRDWQSLMLGQESCGCRDLCLVWEILAKGFQLVIDNVFTLRQLNLSWLHIERVDFMI